MDAAINAFEQTMTEFCENEGARTCDTLTPQAFERLSRSLLAALQEGGRAGLKTYLLQHDTRLPTVRSEGITYRYKNTMEKTILTMLGEISVPRSIYANDLIGGGYVVPLDAALGLRDDYATLETREMILFAAAMTTPGDVEALLKKVGFCHPSATAIQNMINKDGRRMEEHRAEIADKVLHARSIPANAAVMVASMDGANLLLRENGKKKGRKTQRPVDTDAEGEKNTAFRNVMVGAFSFYAQDADGKPQRLQSDYLARSPEEKAPVFKLEFERTIEHYQAIDHDKKLKKILLCDAHRAIWHYAQSCPALRGYEFLVDFYHTTEHLSKAAEAIFGASSAEGSRWYQRWRDVLKTDPTAPQSIIRSMDGYLRRGKLPKSRKEELKRQRVFFKRNKKLMKYARFIEQGYPIGSGPVEAAAKTIVKQRMCRSGMRWNRTGAQYILTLRAHVKSNSWATAWESYAEFLMAA